MITRYYFENGYSGCAQEDMVFWDDDISTIEIDADVAEWGREQAESYSYVHFGWDEPYTDEEYEDYIYNCGWGWEPVSWEEYVEYCENWSIIPNEKWKDNKEKKISIEYNYNYE